MLKRVNVPEKLNELIANEAEGRRLRHEELINEILEDHFKKDENSNYKESFESQRVNALTNEIERLRYEIGVANENVLNRIDTLIEYNESPTYLNDET